MKRLFIIVEGQTEEEFIRSILAPFLCQYSVYSVSPIIIHTKGKHYKGGFVNYQHLKNDIQRLLRSQGDDIFVTTLLDFFRIPTDVPGYVQSQGKISDEEKANLLEKGITSDVSDNRFEAYIQLHEFEALLFASNNGFKRYWSQEEADKTLRVISDYNDSPEDINTTPQGAPSKRLIAIKNGYDKVLEGNILALEVGIENMMTKCPRFKSWVNKIVKMCK